MLKASVLSQKAALDKTELTDWMEENISVALDGFCHESAWQVITETAHGGAWKKTHCVRARVCSCEYYINAHLFSLLYASDTCVCVREKTTFRKWGHFIWYLPVHRVLISIHTLSHKCYTSVQTSPVREKLSSCFLSRSPYKEQSHKKMLLLFCHREIKVNYRLQMNIVLLHLSVSNSNNHLCVCYSLILWKSALLCLFLSLIENECKCFHVCYVLWMSPTTWAFQAMEKHKLTTENVNKNNDDK